MALSRFSRKLYASYALVGLLTSATIGLLVLQPLEGSLVERLEDSLARQCAMLVPFAHDVLRPTDAALPRDAGDLGDRLRQLTRDTGTRVTLIDAGGRVVADSEAAAPSLENHLSRVEVQQALREGSGLARRHSASVGRELLYHAVAVRSGERLLGFARVATSPAGIEARVSAVRQRLLLGAVLGVLVAIGVGIVVARSVAVPIGEMTRTALDLREGRFESRVSSVPGDELGVLAEALNRLGSELTSRIETVSNEEARLRAMLAGMVEGVVAVDDDDRLVFSNRAAREFLGIRRPVDDAPRLWQLVRRAELDDLIREARESAGAARGELVLARGGRELVLTAQANRFQSRTSSGVVVVLEDITELRRLERIRRDFVANVSHELKTPLTSIRGYVETLLSGGLADADNNVRFLGKVQENVRRLQHLVADLLSLARIESQEGPLPLLPVDWRGLVTVAARRYEEAARAKGIELLIQTTPGQLRVSGDAESMTQVLDNLVDNAIKYTPEGGQVVIQLCRAGERGVLEVRDTGVGIPPEDQDRIFERFYRVDKARSNAAGGTGLGLAIVKHLVQSMEGEVGLESAFGRGSRFRVSLPLFESA